MKKLLILVGPLLFCIVVTAQENKVQKHFKSYISISLGPSFPVGDYASTSENNDYAGFAETGFNIDLSYGYKFTSNIGLGLSVLYANHSLDESITQGVNEAAVDHFQMVGIMAGPYFSNKLCNKTELGFRIRVGYATINSPRLVYGGETLVTEDWADAFVWGGGADVKLDVSKNAFVQLGLDYLQARPEFKVTAFNETIKAVQHMAELNLNVGIGLRF